MAAQGVMGNPINVEANRTCVESIIEDAEDRKVKARRLFSLWGQLSAEYEARGASHLAEQLFQQCCKLEYELAGACEVTGSVEDLFSNFLAS